MMLYLFGVTSDIMSLYRASSSLMCFSWAENHVVFMGMESGGVVFVTGTDLSLLIE